jgi:DNA helicase HerA-like ATPase
MSHWANDAGSVIILGRTQTGKTTTAREIAAESDRVVIWVNGRGDNRIRGVPGNRYRSLEGIKRGFARDETTFNLLGDPAASIVALREWLWSVAERTDRQLPLTVIVDELHELAPQTQRDTHRSRDAIRKLSKEGRKRNIKLIGITQDPVSMDKQTLRQREYLVVFSLSAEQARYIADYGVDVDLINDQPQYSGVLFHADGRVLETGLKARGKYA